MRNFFLLFMAMVLGFALSGVANGALGGLTAVAQAQTSTPTGPVKIVDPLNLDPNQPIPDLIGRIIKAALGIVGALALLLFIYGGFLWMTAAGESGKVEKGKNTIVWAVIGLTVIFASYALVTFVIESLTG